LKKDHNIGDPEKRIPPEKIQRAKGTMRWVKARQCATVYKRGKRIGQRCGWAAVENSLHCKKHCGPKVVSEAALEGKNNWFARMRQLKLKDPDVFKRLGFGRPRAEFVAHLELQRAAGLPTNRMIPLKDIPGAPRPPKTDDKHILKAEKIIRQEIATLPAVPDRPFDELEPHEQLTVITGLSLKVVHDILHFEMKDRNGDVDVKVASMVKDTALRALAVRVKVDRNALTARRLDQTADLLARLKNGDDAKVIDQSS
jgi:hypothetical protein